MDSDAIAVIIGLVFVTANIVGRIIVVWSDKRRIRTAVLRSGGRVEWVRLYSGAQELKSWRDLNGLGPRLYQVRWVDADGTMRTRQVFVGVFSGLEWSNSDG